MRAWGTLPYSLFVQSAPAVYIKDATYAGASILDKPLIASRSNDKIRIVLVSDGGTITARGATPGAVVYVLSATAQSESALARTAIAGYVDQNGIFVAEGLPPARYYVLATMDPPIGRTLLPQGYQLLDKTSESISKLRARPRGTPVNVGPGKNVSVTVTPVAVE